MKVKPIFKSYLGGCLLLALFVVGNEGLAQEKKFTISGFGELRYTNRFGDPADPDLAENFEDLGGEDEVIEDGGSVTSPGFNTIITSTLSDRLTFQGEVVFSTEEEDFEVELLRTYVDYKINSKFNLQAGKFLSPIGYLNRNQRSYGYLNYSVQARDMVNKELGFIPGFTVGLKAYGSFDMGSTSSLKYMVAYGGMRGLYPEEGESIAGFEFGEDESNSPGVSGLIEHVSYLGESELTLGFSLYSVGRIVGFSIEDGEDIPLGDEAEEDSTLVIEEMELSEFGIAPYVRLDGNKYQLLFEYHNTTFSDEIGNLEESEYDYSGYSLQLLYKTKLAGKPFYPYIRFDNRTIDEHPYYGLEAEGSEELEKGFVPESQELMLGAAWDILPGNRLKMEYGRYLAGPFPENGLRISTSFGF